MRRCCPECEQPLPPKDSLQTKLNRAIVKQGDLEKSLEVTLVEIEELSILIDAHERAEEREDF